MTTVQEKLHSTPAQSWVSLLAHEFSLLVRRRRGYETVGSPARSARSVPKWLSSRTQCTAFIPLLAAAPIPTP